MVDFNGYDAGGRKKSKMKLNHNQVREPMVLTRNLHQPLVKKFKPDPLHVVKIGVQNDIITNLQQAYPDIVGEWLENLKQRRDRSGMAGNILNGRQMDTVCKDENLAKLQLKLEEIGEGYLAQCTVDYIKACKSLYRCCVRKSLDPDYKAIIRNYTYHFKKLHGLGFVSETPKAHMINSHFEDLMTESGMSFFLYDTNGLEAVHAALKKSDIRHGCMCTHAQVRHVRHLSGF